MCNYFNLYPNKMFAGVFASLAALVCDNLLPLFVTVVLFEAMDFITGVVKSAVLAKRAGRRFAFESVKAWRTIYKVVFILMQTEIDKSKNSLLQKQRMMEILS